MREEPPVTGSRRAIRVYVPGRVNLIGEHTDYNAGLALPFALPLGTSVALRPRRDGVFTARSAGHPPWQATMREVRERAVRGWARYVAGVVWALDAAGIHCAGADLEITGDLPVGAGLSSSASLECAVALALAEDAGLPWDSPEGRRDLAELCRRAETAYVGAPTGGLDQLAVLLSPADGALLVDFGRPLADGPPPTREVALPLAASGLTILVTDTGVSHDLAAQSGYGERRRDCERAAEALGLRSLASATESHLAVLRDGGDEVLARRVRHVLTENERVAAVVALLDAAPRTGHCDGEGLGRLLDASHSSLRDDFEVTVPALDLATEAAVSAGALGARMTGGGFGGSTIALVREGRVDAVRNGIDAAFATAGLTRPEHYLVRPARAGRLLDRLS